MKRAELIYLVEDDPIFAELLISIFEERGFDRIETFFSGESCLREIHKQPSVVVMDYNLNGVKALDTLKEIVSFDSTIPVIFVSGQEDIQDAVDTLRYGAFDYIPKSGDFLGKLDKAIKAIDEANKLADSRSKSKRFLFGLL